jgi:PAS domain S-box-containing protein
MNYQENLQEQLFEKLSALQREVTELRAMKITFDAQRELTNSWAKMAETASGKLMQKSILLTIIQLANQLTQAPESSIFLLDENGVVTDCILARGATIQEKKNNLVGQVLDKGLAGWVIRHRQVGLIEDTMNDDRWFTLPNEPYKVRSALCVPILKGTTLLGLLTLMHPDPGHFHKSSIAYVMESLALQMALVLENAKLHAKPQEIISQMPDPIKTSSPPISDSSSISLVEASGFYIMTATGKLIYVNARFVRIFEYSLAELVALDSVFDLITEESYSTLIEQTKWCAAGKTNRFYCASRGRTKSGKSVNLEIEGSRITSFLRVPALIGSIRVI